MSTTKIDIKLDVRVYPINNPQGNTLAFANVGVEDLAAISGIRVVSGEKGLFVTMPQGHKFSVGLKSDETLIGVVVVGRPIARAYDDGVTAEITRCCVLDNQRNANSKLYAAAIRAARGMGYRRIITYTLPNESGASLKAVGFSLDGLTAHTHSWSVPSRPRRTPEKYPAGSKYRWIKNL